MEPLRWEGRERGKGVGQPCHLPRMERMRSTPCASLQPQSQSVRNSDEHVSAPSGRLPKLQFTVRACAIENHGLKQVCKRQRH